jgi:hypothetical protein
MWYRYALVEVGGALGFERNRDNKRPTFYCPERGSAQAIGF